MKKHKSGELTAIESPIKLNGTDGNDAEVDWDLNALRLDQNFDSIIGAQPVIATVSVRKPHAQEWFRVHPDDNWRLPTTILQMKEDRESYLIDPPLRSQLWQEIQPILLCTVVSRQDELFLWPVRLPKSDGKTDRFIDTDLAAVKVAERNWTRRYWVPELKNHKILIATNLADNPSWPTEVDFQKIIQIAFKDRFINDLNHPVLRKLRGEL